MEFIDILYIVLTVLLVILVIILAVIGYYVVTILTIAKRVVRRAEFMTFNISKIGSLLKITSFGSLLKIIQFFRRGGDTFDKSTR